MAQTEEVAGLNQLKLPSDDNKSHNLEPGKLKTPI